MKPVLMLTTSQSDGLKPPRWFYEGESFVIGHFAAEQRPKMDCTESELFGRHISITAEALKHLSGGTLALRGVDAQYGLMKNTHYVLVADSTPESPTHVFGAGDISEKIKRGFPIGALTILGGFTGMGVFWIVYGLIAAALRIPDDKFFGSKVIFPIFVTGWIVGAIASFFFFRSVYKTSGQTRFAQEPRQELQWDMDWWIFLGIPASLTAILLMTLLPFAHSDSQKVYGSIVVLMIVLGGSMYFCDKMPRRLIMRLGIFGWVITFILGYFFFKIHGP